MEVYADFKIKRLFGKTQESSTTNSTDDNNDKQHKIKWEPAQYKKMITFIQQLVNTLLQLPIPQIEDELKSGSTDYIAFSYLFIIICAHTLQLKQVLY